MDLRSPDPALNLYNQSWPLRTAETPNPPAKFVFDEIGRRGMAIDSLVSGGCIVSGALLRRSILFTGARVAEGSVIEDAVVLPQASIGRGVRLRRCIVDKRCVLPDGLQVGFDVHRDRERFHVTERGIVLITPGMLGAA